MSKTADQLLDQAWGVIANAGWDGLDKTEGWQDAAIRWRDQYHTYLDDSRSDRDTTVTPPVDIDALRKALDAWPNELGDDDEAEAEATFQAFRAASILLASPILTTQDAYDQAALPVLQLDPGASGCYAIVRVTSPGLQEESVSTSFDPCPMCGGTVDCEAHAPAQAKPQVSLPEVGFDG